MIEEKKVIRFNDLWMHQEDWEAMKKWRSNKEKEWADYIFYGIVPEDKRTEEQKYTQYLKYAYVIINNKQELVHMHPEDKRIYACNETNPGLKEPLTEITTPFKFKRWCSSFDI